MASDENKIKCKNCRQFICADKMFLHEGFCNRNNVFCEHCERVFLKKDYNYHLKDISKGPSNKNRESSSNHIRENFMSLKNSERENSLINHTPDSKIKHIRWVEEYEIKNPIIIDPFGEIISKKNKNEFLLPILGLSHLKNMNNDYFENDFLSNQENIDINKNFIKNLNLYQNNQINLNKINNNNLNLEEISNKNNILNIKNNNNDNNDNNDDNNKNDIKMNLVIKDSITDKNINKNKMNLKISDNNLYNIDNINNINQTLKIDNINFKDTNTTSKKKFILIKYKKEKKEKREKNDKNSKNNNFIINNNIINYNSDNNINSIQKNFKTSQKTPDKFIGKSIINFNYNIPNENSVLNVSKYNVKTCFNPIRISKKNNIKNIKKRFINLDNIENKEVNKEPHDNLSRKSQERRNNLSLKEKIKFNRIDAKTEIIDLKKQIIRGSEYNNYYNDNLNSNYNNYSEKIDIEKKKKVLYRNVPKPKKIDITKESLKINKTKIDNSINNEKNEKDFRQMNLSLPFNNKETFFYNNEILNSRKSEDKYIKKNIYKIKINNKEKEEEINNNSPEDNNRNNDSKKTQVKISRKRISYNKIFRNSNRKSLNIENSKFNYTTQPINNNTTNNIFDPLFFFNEEIKNNNYIDKGIIKKHYNVKKISNQ